MIYNQWYVVLESKELKKKKPLKIKRFGEQLALWRNQKNEVCCIDDKCCHRGASLSCGKIVDGEIECPFHGFLYNKVGQVTYIPANGKNAPISDAMEVSSYKTHESYGFIWLWWGDKDKIEQDPFFFEELGDFTYSTFKDEWNSHYSRSIENQLDVVHLPFVHKTTIGRGDKVIVNGPVVIREGNMLNLYVYNTKDDGNSVPLRPDEIKDYKKHFHLQFHYPNIWQNLISDKVRTFAAFVPVDDENSIVYVRFYQRITKVPVLKHLMNFSGRIFSKIVLRQDKRVVTSQIPKRSDLKIDEKLIVGDLPIVEYRKYRKELIEKNNKVN